MKKTGAVLAAAGLSSRMHAYKPLLPYNGSTVARTVTGRLLEAGADPVVVVTGFRAEELKRHLSGYGIRFVWNAAYRETDMFTSICLGLRAIEGTCESVLIQPLDLPGIRTETIRAVLSCGGPVVRPVSGGKPGHPVRIDCRLIETICSYTGEDGLKGALMQSGVPITELPVVNDGIWFDIDTEEEYLQLLHADRPDS